jgi:hypothetical protein
MPGVAQGMRSLASSQRMTPKPHMSHCTVSVEPTSCSGDMYGGLPVRDIERGWEGGREGRGGRERKSQRGRGRGRGREREREREGGKELCMFERL